jgi:hypothetical protein
LPEIRKAHSSALKPSTSPTIKTKLLMFPNTQIEKAHTAEAKKHNT